MVCRKLKFAKYDSKDSDDSEDVIEGMKENPLGLLGPLSLLYPCPMFLWLTAVVSAVLSLLAAFAAEAWLTDRIPVLGSFAGFVLAHNPGIAFSIKLPPVVQEVLIVIALLLVGWTAVRSSRTSLDRIGFGLVLGGAVANLIDRFLDGLVTDYIQVGTFPVFNLADSCITVGVGLVVLGALLGRDWYQAGAKN